MAPKPIDAVDGPPRPALGVNRIRPAYEQVAEQLRALIIEGRLKPTDRLPVEGELSATFGVSRSTIREALRLLSSDGLVQTMRGVNGGTFVAEVNTSSISDFLETRLGLLTGHDLITAAELLEARHLLEVPAARLAAARRTSAHVEAMHAAIAREREETERGRRFEHHQQFHAILLAAAGNRLLDLMTVPVFRVIRARFIGDRPPLGFWRDVDDDHALILAKIEEEDGDGAAQAMADHLDRLTAIYSRVKT